EDFAALQAPTNVIRIPKSLGSARSITGVVEFFDRSNQSANDVDTIGQMQIDFRQHKVLFINPNRTGSFIDETIFQAARRQFFVRGLEVNQKRVAPAHGFAFDQSELKTAEQIVVQEEIIFIE